MISPCDIVGHESRRKALQRLIEKGKLPSTMMFAGASGTGKLLVAKELCRTLVCDNNSQFTNARLSEKRSSKSSLTYGGCGSCKSCHLFDSSNSPDYHYVQCLEKESSNVGTLRELLYSLNLNSFSGKCRLVVFDNAEYLSLQASNLLLKTFEEPRPDTYFILVTASPSRLPATILSRCQVWFFDSLRPEEIEQIIERKLREDPSCPYSGMPLKELALLSDGSLDGLQHITQNFQRWLTVKEILPKIFAGEIPIAVEYSNKLAKDKENLRAELQLMRIFTRERMRNSDTFENTSRWSVFISNTISAERLIFERNLAPANVLLTSFLALSTNPRLKTFTTLTNSVSLLEKISV